MVMKAYKIIHENYPDVEVVAVGETPGKAKYAVYISVDEIDDRPSFSMTCRRAPEYDEIAKDYRKATMLPKYDSWGEAMDAVIETHKLVWASRMANAS